MLLVLCQRGDTFAYKYVYSLLNKSNTVLLTMNFSETFHMSGDSSERNQHIDFPPLFGGGGFPLISRALSLLTRHSEAELWQVAIQQFLSPSGNCIAAMTGKKAS